MLKSKSGNRNKRGTNSKSSNRENLRAMLALSLIPGLGIKRLTPLLENNSRPMEIFKYSKTRLRSFEGIGEASSLAILSFDRWDEVDQILDKSRQSGTTILSYADPDYPYLLKQIYDPPLLLWVKGEIKALSAKGIAVVGTRNATAYGKKIAEKLSLALAENGLCIFSGLAYGIDAIAHRSALKAGTPTVAVLGSGINKLYPSRHRSLAGNIIADGGALVTEYPPDTVAEPGFFPVRNRIVSGLSLGVLVVESGLQGGSMITANLALDQNRESFAVPHSLDNISGSGCNYLIKKGAAKLVQTADDILEELPLERKEDSGKEPVQPIPAWQTAGLSGEEQKICSLLQEKSYHIDALSERLKMNVSQVLVILLQLEMKRLVHQRAGKIFELN